MFLSWFIALGPFLLLAARKPSLHRSLIAFAACQSLFHASVMTIQTVQARKHGVHRDYTLMAGQQTLPYRITEGLQVMRAQSPGRSRRICPFGDQICDTTCGPCTERGATRRLTIYVAIPHKCSARGWVLEGRIRQS